MIKSLILALATLATAQLDSRQLPGAPGATDVARCVATGDCPASLATSQCLGSVDMACAEELCGIENLGKCVSCLTATGTVGSWSVAALQALCPDVPMNVTGNATAPGNGTETNGTAPGNATHVNGTVTGNGTHNATGNATVGGNGTHNGTGNGTAPGGGHAGAEHLMPAAVLGLALAAGAMLV